MTTTNVKVHYMNAVDVEVLAEMNVKDYYNLLMTEVGLDLARQLDAKLRIIETDPRVSDLNETDVFVSYVDVASKLTSASDLLEELSPELTNAARWESKNQEF